MVFGFFKKKKEKSTIHIKEIDSWIKKVIESRNTGIKLGIHKRELNSKKTRLKELLDELMTAKLKDESIVPERAKSIFEGNRKSYVQKINLFLDTINFPDDVSEVESFLENASLNLEKLAEETNKNYFIIKEFIEDDVRQIANRIKELDNLIVSTRASIEKASLIKFKELREMLELHNSYIMQVEKNKSQLEQVLERKAQEIEKRKKIESKLNTLKSSSQHEEFSNLKKKKEELQEKLKQTEYNVIDLFSGISSVLKKYSKKKQNKHAKNYSDNAVNGLLLDENLNILKVLEDVLKLKDSLDVKDSKLKKLESEIKRITKKKLEDLRTSLIDTTQSLNDLNNRIKNHSFRLNLKEQEGKIEIVDETLKEIEKEEQELEDLLERTNPRLIKQKMKNLIKEIDEYTELI
jgi:hypothetical protein